MVFKFVILASIVAMISADSYSAPLEDKPLEFEDEEGCYVGRIQEVIPFGGFASFPGECTRIECERYSVTYSKCDYLQLPDDEKCMFVDNPDDFFPQCCPTIRCSE